MPRAVIVIHNPLAGQRGAGLLWRVLDILAGNGIRVEVVETVRPGHASALAAAASRDGARLVVAAGGDGTVAEVASGIAGGAAHLGVIPLGTANVLARELNLPMAPRAVAAALAFGRTRALWPGIARGAAGDRLFVQMLGVGFDAQVVHRLRLPLKRALGRSAYVAQTLREMIRYKYPPVSLRIDGQPAEAASVIVTKGSLYAGQYLLAPGAQPSEKGFSVALFERAGLWPALQYGAALPLNLLPSLPGFRLVRAARVEFPGADGTPAQVDGDPAGAVPISVRDADAPLRIVVS